MEPFTVLSLGYAKIPHSTNYPKNRCNREKIQHKLATHGALSYLCRRKVKPTDTHIYMIKDSNRVAIIAGDNEVTFSELL